MNGLMPQVMLHNAPNPAVSLPFRTQNTYIAAPFNAPKTEYILYMIHRGLPNDGVLRCDAAIDNHLCSWSRHWRSPSLRATQRNGAGPWWQWSSAQCVSVISCPVAGAGSTLFMWCDYRQELWISPGLWSSPNKEHHQPFYLSNDHAQHLTAAYLWRGEERGGFVEITHSIELGPATRCWL